MSPRARYSPRGTSLIEALATMTILLAGVAGVALTVLQVSRANRRNLAQTQAEEVAERELERIVTIGCNNANPADPCANVKALDNTTRPSLYWSSGGSMQEGPDGGTNLREYAVAIDVDPPFEGNEVGVPSLQRTLANGQAGLQVNVRVTVSWDEVYGFGTNTLVRQAVALQTRMAP